MTEKQSMIRAVLAGALCAAIGLGVPMRASGASKACGLLTAGELEAVLGGKVSGLKEGGAAGSGVELCTATTPAASVLIRLVKKRGAATGAEAKGIAMAKQMGVQVEVKTFGPITCSSMIPPKSLEQYGFNTTCAVDKGDRVAAVEVTAKTQKDRIPIDKLRPLAEKLAGRF